MTGNTERVNEIRKAEESLMWVADQGIASRSVKIVLDRLQELESALNWETSCTSCAKVMDSSIKETEAKERAVRLVEEYRKDVQDARAWNELLKKALMRSNEKYRKAHRRALGSEKKLMAMQLIPVYITDHTFDGDEGKPCPTEIFGVKCGLGEEFHHMKPSRCPEPDTCFCDCSCPDQENLGHTCSLHSGQEKPALTAWEEHVMKYGTVPGAGRYGDHQYLSTACHDLEHDKCRRTCEWYPSACLCGCHSEPSGIEGPTPGPLRELAAAFVADLRSKTRVSGGHCPASTGGMCVYEAQGYRRCFGGCEVSPKS